MGRDVEEPVLDTNTPWKLGRHAPLYGPSVTGTMDITQVADAIRNLGIQVQERPLAPSQTFLREVWLDQGTVLYTPKAHPSDLFHEAGHYAVTPPSFREHFRPGDLERENGELSLLMRKIDEHMQSVTDPDDFLTRALLQSGECEAIAWSFAAAQHIGFNTKLVFTHTYPGLPKHRQPFQGEGKDLHSSVKAGAYFGVHGLHHGRMCNRRQWPTMLKWLQDAV